ncbi:eukaryotic aspartyl protease family [Trichoderma cornu-damae]|uniref:Eukaryotic aspartyl protease family n=1 Tax=Trichoderma cornu-damae TaxID=654480 RepID=A0A9P8QMA7_9HYPO|nr:eukaryotic aspartyl protease family [Trichoderma cornu-damae]
MGIWQLGLEYLGYGGNGQYGLDTVNAYSTITDIGFGMSNVLMSAINTTDYYIGILGLGITQGNFGHEVAQSPLTQARAGNIPVSITLGGYDTARYVPHDIDFTLTPQDNMPRALVRGIEASANNSTAKPKEWESWTTSLSGWNNSFTALIDSTTPYLWLPNAVCDEFAEAFNLTYNKTFDLYTLTNEQYNNYGSFDSFVFTFSFSSFDNHDNFGSPLDIPGLVNITVPMRAFVSLLQYPFMNRAIRYGDPAVPYFALRRSQHDSAVVIGRSFLQEAYLITKYDEAVFSVHQAKFPQRPIADAKLVPIKQPNNSPYPPPPKQTGTKLDKGQMVGIAEKGDKVTVKETKDYAPTPVPNTARIPRPVIFPKFLRCKRLQRKETSFAATAVLSDFTEAPDSEIYELPAPMAPVELDASDGDDDSSMVGDSILGTGTTRSFSAYEVARRKIDRQLQGQVPEYSPPLLDTALPSHTVKAAYAGSSRETTPVSPIKSGSGTNSSLPASLPSPISSGSGHCSHPDGALYSIAASPADQPPDSGSRGHDDCRDEENTRWGISRSNSRRSESPAASPRIFAPSSTMACQKTPIDPTTIVCLGNLPENLQSLRHSIMLARIVSQENRNSGDSFAPRFNAEFHLSDQSLGSNYTEEEDRIMLEMTRQATLSLARSQGGPPPVEQEAERSEERFSNQEKDSPYSSQGEGRIDGNDIVHIPQMAAKRYSWED